MSVLPYEEIFGRAQAGRVGFVEVPMDSARIIVLAEGQSGAIATRRLGACSGLVILGRSAAIMAHIAPRSPTAQLGATSSAQHFRVFVGQMEQLYISNRRHFPPETTAWGFYLTGVHEITDELKAIASHRFAILGLRNRHTGYHPFEGPNRRDEIRACLQLIGPGFTHFYIEYVLMENMMLPRPSPDRQAPRGTALSESNFLVWSANAGKAIQMFYGQPVEPGQLSGTYEIRCANPNGVIAWPRYNFDTRQWVR